MYTEVFLFFFPIKLVASQRLSVVPFSVHGPFFALLASWDLPFWPGTTRFNIIHYHLWQRLSLGILRLAKKLWPCRKQLVHNISTPPKLHIHWTCIWETRREQKLNRGTQRCAFLCKATWFLLAAKKYNLTWEFMGCSLKGPCRQHISLFNLKLAFYNSLNSIPALEGIFTKINLWYINFPNFPLNNLSSDVIH